MKVLFIILLILASTLVHGRSIENSFIAKDWNQVVDSYLANKEFSYSEKVFTMISHSLRKTGRYREAVLLNIRIIKKFYSVPHAKLLKEVSTGATTDPDDYSEKLKIYYWNVVSDYASYIKSLNKKTPEVERDFKRFQDFVKILEALEFRERQADKLISSVQSHLIYLVEKVYRFSASISINHVSWQREVQMSGAQDAKLLVTNRGYCLGGDAGVENYRYHFYFDGCFMFGVGGINNKDASVQYQQDNVPTYGFKGGPGASLIVSSSKSRIGIKLPVIYSVQKFEQPSSGPAGSYAVKLKNPLSLQASIYSRFNLNSYFIQTEFGQYLGNDETFWAIGFGKQF